MNTAPGSPNAAQLEQAFARGESVKIAYDKRCEVYTVKTAVWKAAAKEDLRGVLCIGCLEKRLGRTLRPKDFDAKNPLNRVPGTDRLISRRMGMVQP
jgi:hypothetical protein